VLATIKPKSVAWIFIGYKRRRLGFTCSLDCAKSATTFMSARTILLEYYVPTVLTEHLLVEICCCGLALLV
jgi:hypothetical protein